MFAAPSGGPSVAYMDADQSLNTSTTLTNISDLVIAVGANQIWFFRGTIQVGDQLDSSGLMLGFNAPASTSGWVSAQLFDVYNTVPNPYYSGKFDPAASTDFGGGTMAFTTGILEFSAFIDTAGTAGNVQVQFAQCFSVGANLTFKTGSYMIGDRMA